MSCVFSAPSRVVSLAVPLAVALSLSLLGACAAPRGGGPDAAGFDASVRDGSSGGPLDAGPRPDRALPDAGFGEVCLTGTAYAEPLPATLMFQVDTSGSMNCGANERGCAVADPTPAPDDSRWDVFRARLTEALDALPNATRAGLMHFPGGESSCAPATADVAIAPLTTSRPAIGAALAALVPRNITPTHDAVANALALLRAESAERRYLVLATDGAATVCLGCDAGCSFDALDADNEELVARVAAASADGIPTFVIGVPGSQSYRGTLSRLASAAGTARAGCSDAGPLYCHYDLTDASIDLSTGLRDALASIGEAVVSCEYEIPPNPDGTFDPARVNVVITYDDGSTETLRRDRGRADGWDYSDDGLRIELHGPACERAEALREGRVDVFFGCPTILI
jgi:hypothetical protein